MTATRKVELRARCSHQEQAALRAIAQYEQLKPSEALRQIVREAAEARGLWPPGEDGQEKERQVVDQAAACKRRYWALALKRRIILQLLTRRLLAMLETDYE